MVFCFHKNLWSICFLVNVCSNVADPDPNPDPYVFGPHGKVATWRSMTKIAGSGSISQKHGSADPDPDPQQNVIDPEHWFAMRHKEMSSNIVYEPKCGGGVGRRVSANEYSFVQIKLCPYLIFVSIRNQFFYCQFDLTVRWHQQQTSAAVARNVILFSCWYYRTH